MINLINANCLDVIDNFRANSIIVTDPPFNIGYHYKSYKDKLKEDEYYSMLVSIIKDTPSVIIHYPENLYKLSICLNTPPRTSCFVVL